MLSDWLGSVAQLLIGLLLIGGVFFVAACLLPTAIVIEKKDAFRGGRSRNALINQTRAFADRLLTRHWKAAALLYGVIFATVVGCVLIVVMFGMEAAPR